MRFSCARCGRQYATKDPPLPDRIYRVRCRGCDNVIVIRGGDLATHPAPAPAPVEVPAAVTPLADLAPPPSPPSPASRPVPPVPTPAPVPSPPPAGAASTVSRNARAPEELAARPAAGPPASPSPPPPAEPRYIELFEQGDFGDEAASPTAAAPPPSPPTEALPAVEPPPATEPVLAESLTDELSEAAESLRQSLIGADTFGPAEDFELSTSESPLPRQPSADTAVPPPATPEPAAADEPATPAGATRPQRRRLVAAGASIVVVFALAAAGLLANRSRGSRDDTRAIPAVEPQAPPPVQEAQPQPATPAPDGNPRHSGLTSPAEPDTAMPPTPSAPPPVPAPTAQPEALPAPSPASSSPTVRRPAPAPRPAAPPDRPAAHPGRPKKPERADRRVAATDRRGQREPPPTPAAASPSAPAPAPVGGDVPRRAELTPEQIQEVLATSRKAFDACVRDAPRGTDPSGGDRQVAIRFLVAPEGTVSYPTIDDVTISAAPLGQCLKAAARNMSFPEFTGDPVKVDAQITLPAR